ncbi:cytochrome P450 [Trichoderma chlorosporum]
MFVVFAAGIAVSITLLLYHQFFRKKNAFLSLPPGPKPLPILGNTFDLPPPGIPEFQYWLKFKDLYGPISSVTSFGQTVLILHDKEATYDLMAKMASKTSGRPTTVFAYELCGFKHFTSGKQYDATFRLHRKFMHQQAGTKLIASQYNEIQDVESRRLLKRILDDPRNVKKHFKTVAAAIILKSVYGYSIEPHGADPLTELIEEMMSNLGKALMPSARLVDMIPALKYLPDGFPGTGFKETARQWNKTNHDAVNLPYSFVNQQMEKGVHRPSFVSALIERYASDRKNTGKQDSTIDEDIKWTAGIMYGGGSDTTASALSAFSLAMTLFPEVQKTAQEEIDKLIGAHPNRLPQFEDREQLPYTSAVIKELMRWYTIVPIATPHMTDDEIVYRGYRIPKGSIVLPQTWWYHHDPQTYPDPLCFSPERYFEPRNEPDPISEVFGWGRRICPGRYIADDNLFIMVSQLLAVFNISKATDEQGRQIEPKVEYVPGLISHPPGFSTFTVRSERHKELINAIEVDHPWEKSDADLL